MTQGQRLNFKWSMADVDFVVGLARARRSADEICDRLRLRTDPGRRLTATPEEIRDICWQSGLTVRMAPRAGA